MDNCNNNWFSLPFRSWNLSPLPCQGLPGVGHAVTPPNHRKPPDGGLQSLRHGVSEAWRSSFNQQILWEIARFHHFYHSVDKR